MADPIWQIYSANQIPWSAWTGQIITSCLLSFGPNSEWLKATDAVCSSSLKDLEGQTGWKHKTCRLSIKQKLTDKHVQTEKNSLCIMLSFFYLCFYNTYRETKYKSQLNTDLQ